MGFIQNARVTNRTHKLVEAVEVNLLPTSYYEVVGACGHRLLVIRENLVSEWKERIATRSRFRKRCDYCLK